MKKVAIITLPLSNYNYGGLLQAYALQNFLKDNYDISVTHLDRQYNSTKILDMKTAVHRLLNKNYYKAVNQYYAPIIKFISSHIDVTEKIASEIAMDNYLRNNKIELLITGSDQVWNRNYAYNINNDLLLNIPYKCTKISYAASFGSNQYAEENVSEKIKNLNGISVREKDAKQYLSSYGIEAIHHIDPTLLLDVNEYKDLAKSSKKNYTDGVTSYVLDKKPETEEFSKLLSKLANKPLNKVGSKKSISKQNYRDINQSVDSLQDWLNAFYSADYIITDSFHGCVFSILFNKQFITLGNKERGHERFLSLLSLFGLENRLITSKEEVEKVFLPIDYNTVNAKLEELRAESKRYFDQFLSV